MPENDVTLGIPKSSYIDSLMYCDIPGGGVLPYVHTYICLDHFWGLRKMNVWGFEEIVDFFFWGGGGGGGGGGSLHLSANLGVISIHFRAFSRYRMRIFWGSQNV